MFLTIKKKCCHEHCKFLQWMLWTRNENDGWIHCFNKGNVAASYAQHSGVCNVGDAYSNHKPYCPGVTAPNIWVPFGPSMHPRQ